MHSLLPVVALGALVAQLGFGTEGNGRIKQEARAVGDFKAVAVGGGIRATVTLGDKPSVVLEGDENLLPLVESQVKDGRLTLRPRESIRPSRPIKATIVATRMKAATASGGARLETQASPGGSFAASASGGADLAVTGLACDSLAVEASGGAEVKVSGRAKKIAAEASGGAELRLHGVPAESAAVEASGGARIEAAVSAEIVGSASGGASIHLKGKPARRTVATSGGARVVDE